MNGLIAVIVTIILEIISRVAWILDVGKIGEVMLQ